MEPDDIKYKTPYRLKNQAFDHPAGTICYRQEVYDYGLASDDSNFTGVPHVSMTLNEQGDYPGFTVPVHDLEEVK